MYRILIAEDDRVHAIMLQRYLEMLGHETTIVSSGVQALESLDGHDLVLMDINMPEMDGLEATRAIRAGMGSDAGVPIIAITAHAEDDCSECMEAGMNDVLVKPVFLAKVVATINAHVPGADEKMPAQSTH